MAKLDRGRGRYRYRYRRDAGWDSAIQNRILLGCRHHSVAKFERYIRARSPTGQGSIPISIPIPIPIPIGRIGRIGSIAWRRCVKERVLSGALATEGTEFTERFFLSPSTGQPLLQPGCVEIGKNVRLCVLGDLCGRTFLTSVRPKKSMAKLDRGRGRGRYRYRRDAGWDSAIQNRILLRCRHNSAAKFERYIRARSQPERESIPIPIPIPTPIQTMI
jgi:hypothetical protein